MAATHNFLDFNGVLFSRSYSTTLLRFPPAMNMSSLHLSDFKADNGKVTIVSIASGAFANSRYLKSVTLPSTITSISANAFLNSSITSISIPTTADFHWNQRVPGLEPHQRDHSFEREDDQQPRVPVLQEPHQRDDQQRGDEHQPLRVPTTAPASRK